MTTSTRERILEAAAEARGQGVRQSSHRPSQRRCAEEQGTGAWATVRGARMSMRAEGVGDGERLHFAGFASVYNRSYEMWDMFGPYDEQVSTGAGAKSLARADLDVPLVLQHDPMRRIARTLNGSLVVDERTEGDGDDAVEGLYAEASDLNPRDADVAYIAQKLLTDGDRAPLIDEMSFRFRIERGEWSPDWLEYHITQYEIHRGDVAICAYGANPHTQGAGLRSAQLAALDDLTDPQLRELEARLHAERRSRGTDVAPSMSRAALAAIDDMLRV